MTGKPIVCLKSLQPAGEGILGVKNLTTMPPSSKPVVVLKAGVTRGLKGVSPSPKPIVSLKKGVNRGLMGISPLQFRGTLYDFQARFVNWAQDKDVAIVDAEMGLGKTPMFIAHCCDRQYPRILLVMPVSLINQCRREWLKFTNLRPEDITVYQGSGRLSLNLRNSRVILTNYDSVRIDMENFDSPLYQVHHHLNIVGLDEGHLIRNSKTRIHQACCKLRDVCPNRWVLTGTVIHNKFSDFVSLANFLGIYGTQHYSPTQLEAFKVRYYYRLTKAEAQVKLPKREIDHNLEFDEDHAMEYNEALAEVKAIYTKYTAEPTQVNYGCLLAKITRLRQACNHPNAMLSAEDREIPSNLYPHQDSAKFELLGNHHKENPEDKILVFSQWEVSLDLLAEYYDTLGITHMKYHGGMSSSQKQAVVDEFHTNSTQVLLITLNSGGVGLNLTCANHVFILDSWWNGSLEEQAVNRVHRIGQTKTVYIHRMYMIDTIEFWVKELKAEKHKVSQMFIEHNAPSETNKGMLKKLLHDYI